VVTLKALEPFKTEGPAQVFATHLPSIFSSNYVQTNVLPHLQEKGAMTYDIELNFLVSSKTLDKPHIISKSNFKYPHDKQVANINIKQINERSIQRHSVNTCTGV
jgi:hypothetical protein